jgi:hypothetical protein
VRALSDKWEEYWSGAAGKGDASFYKSTLIHPLTLWDNDISEEFKRGVNISNVDRSIFGFLCFDHRDVNYFEEDADAFVAKIFADIMCTYVFIRMIYTDFSSTFIKVREVLGKNSVNIQMHKIDQIKPPQTREGLGKYLVPPAGIPDAPSLVFADKVLLDFVQSGARKRKAKL